MNKENVKLIRDFIGKFLEVDFTQDGTTGWSTLLRIRMEVNVEKPIKTGFHNP